MNKNSLQIEELPPFPEDALAQLSEYCRQLDAVIEKCTKTLESSPEGSLKVSSRKWGDQFYQRLSAHKKVYLGPGQISVVRQLAQKEYVSKVLPELRRQSRLLSGLSNPRFSDIINSMVESKRKLIKPLTLSDSSFAEIWQSVQYVHKFFRPDSPDFYTVRGERVRSKSEIIIADMLYRFEVPYRYEFPVKAGDVHLHPDFYCLNKRTRQEFIWEHFGLMDDSDYARRAVEKIRLYKMWEKKLPPLIATFETGTKPAGTKYFEAVIKSHLL